LLELALKMYERKAYERCIGKTVHIHSNQFGFMPGRGTIDLINLSKMQEKILEENNKRY